jgi:hydrocephalus-inducing protein
VLRPWCHFELPESDYITGGRRNPEQPGPSGAIEPLDPATKVGQVLQTQEGAMWLYPACRLAGRGLGRPSRPPPLLAPPPLPLPQVLEFESLGVRVRNAKRFFVLNPTSIAYEFTWAPAARTATVAGAARGQASPFACGTRRGVIGGGRCGRRDGTPGVEAAHADDAGAPSHRDRQQPPHSPHPGCLPQPTRPAQAV